MGRWLDRLLGRNQAAAPLRGGRDVKRVKSYAAQSGYVYEYTYEGMRTLPDRSEQHVFSVSSDRKTWSASRVTLLPEACAEWSRKHGRDLTSNERYAAVKMGLFALFDSADSPAGIHGGTVITAAAIDELLGSLDL